MATEIVATKKKNRIGRVPRPTGLDPMRLAQVGLGFGVGLPGKSLDDGSIPGQVRVLFFLTRNARQLTLPESPVRSLKLFDKKTPLQQPTREEP
jgi:hypothetical protein